MVASKLTLALFALVGQATVALAGVERPPQFVVMAFDNCSELERWQELSEFAADLNRDAARVHFTFFVSASNFIPDARRGSYEGPGARRGTSRINFGGSAQDVRKRIEYASALYRDGHEIASHAVGHFNGASWSASEWGKEFRAFGSILDNAVAHRDVAEPRAPEFSARQIAGFRAPYLAT